MAAIPPDPKVGGQVTEPQSSLLKSALTTASSLKALPEVPRLFAVTLGYGFLVL